MRENEAFLKEAIRLAQEKMEANEGGPFGALVVYGDKVVGCGWNRVTSTNDPTAHAEIMAIREACRELSRFSLEGCTLYSSCEPCPMCLSAIYWSRIDQIVYAASRQDAASIEFDDAYIYEQVALAPEDRSIPMNQILRDEALKVFDAWRNKQDKILY